MSRNTNKTAQQIANELQDAADRAKARAAKVVASTNPIVNTVQGYLD